MTARQLRRRNERKSRKLLRKQASNPVSSAPELSDDQATADKLGDTSSKLSAARLRANRENSRFSTGPRTSAGKLTSAQNSRRHGLTGTFCVLPDEDAAAYEGLQADLFSEHLPATPTERLLVESMARHHWLAQRAIRLQETCFENIDSDDRAWERRLALFLRYQSTHERAFHRCLAELIRVRRAERVERRELCQQEILDRKITIQRQDDPFYARLAAERLQSEARVRNTESTSVSRSFSTDDRPLEFAPKA